MGQPFVQRASDEGDLRVCGFLSSNINRIKGYNEISSSDEHTGIIGLLVEGLPAS